MNKHYRNSFERKQYIDQIIEEYRVKKIQKDSNSSSKKELKSNDQSNSNVSRQQDDYQLKKSSNENDRSRNNNNMQEFETTVSTTNNKNQMSDEYHKAQGLNKVSHSARDEYFEQQMYKSLYCQKLQQQMQDRMTDGYTNQYQMMSNNKQTNYSNPIIPDNIHHYDTNSNQTKIINTANVVHNSIVHNSNIHQHNNAGVNDYRNEANYFRDGSMKQNECTIKINGVDHQINLNDIPSQLFNQSVRNSVYMSNQFKPIIKKHVYQDRQWKIQDFKIVRQLGNGKYGEVYLCKDILTNFMVALKVINQKVIDKEDLEKQLAREIMIHSYLKHPNILEMYGWFRDKYNVYLILEYCQQGELFKLLSKQRNLRFEEEIASHYIKQLIEALLYLKQQQVIHRDVKPENILVSNENIKLCDFGWSVYDDQFQRRMTFCGTADYVSPEMINNEKYDCRVDTWSVGVLTYELLTGKPPFSSNFVNNNGQDNQMSYQMIFRNITEHKKEQIQFPEYISQNAQKFIRSILEKNQEERAELRYLKRDKWILENCKEDQRIAQIKTKVKQFL